MGRAHGPTIRAAMSTAEQDLTRELEAVELARQGGHAAFVELYRQDAPPAWRLALALTFDADRAAEAVADGFRRALAPGRAGTAQSALPFRLRLLTTTRQAALDGPGRNAVRLPGPDAPTAAPARRRNARAAEVMAAFGKLPERWRTILWLLVIEGLGTLDAARVLKVRPDEAEDLAERAQAGLRERWTRDQRDAGVADPVPPEHLDRQLQPVLPLPPELFALTEARWLATRRRDPGPLRLVLPGGRPVPRWAERLLVGATAVLIALGITSALAVDRDPRRARGTTLAEPDEDDADPSTGGDESPTEPKAYLDGDVGPAAATQAARSATATGSPRGADVGDLAAGPATPAGDDGSPATSAPPELVPLLEVTLGVGDTLGISLGDRCTGLELLGTVAGCAPDTAPEGLTLDVDSALLPGS